jgi:hypothetical protein
LQFFRGLPGKNACPEALLLACLDHVTGIWNEERKPCSAGVEH